MSKKRGTPDQVIYREDCEKWVKGVLIGDEAKKRVFHPYLQRHFVFDFQKRAYEKDN